MTIAETETYTRKTGEEERTMYNPERDSIPTGMMLGVLTAQGAQPESPYLEFWEGKANLVEEGKRLPMDSIDFSDAGGGGHTQLYELARLNLSLSLLDSAAAGFESRALSVKLDAPLGRVGEHVMENFSGRLVTRGEAGGPAYTTEISSPRWSIQGWVKIDTYNFHCSSCQESFPGQAIGENVQGSFQFTLTGPGRRRVVIKQGKLAVAFFHKSRGHG